MLRIRLLLTLTAVCCLLQPALTFGQGMSKDEIQRQRNKAQEFRKQKKYAEEAAVYEQILPSAERVHGKTDLVTAVLLNNLATAYVDLRQYAKAEPHYLRSLSISEAKRSKDDHELALTLNNLGILYHLMKQDAKAEPYYLRSLNVRELKQPKDHADVIAVRNSLATVYRGMPGQNAKAEAQYHSILEALEAKQGKNHPDLVPTLNNLGAVYRAMDQKAKAEAQYSRGLQIVEAKYGKDHANTAIPVSNLATLYLSMGEHAKAEPFFLRHLKYLETKNGKDAPALIFYLNELARLYSTTFQLVKAEPLYQRAMQINELKYGKDHLAVATSCNSLANIYRSMGEYAKAEPLLRRSLEIREAKLDKNHALVATALNDLANVYSDTAQYAKAEPLYVRGLAIREADGKNLSAVALALNNLAIHYQNMGRFAQAEQLCQRGLDIREEKFGKEHTEVAQSLTTLAGLYSTLGRYAKAEPLYQRALQIREDKQGKDHPDVATALSSLAGLYRLMGQYSQAEPLDLRSLEIREAKLAKDHPAVATSLSNLASLYRSMGQYAKSEPLQLRSLAIRETKNGKNHPVVATSLNNLAVLYDEMGQRAKAEPLYLRSLEIREAKLGKDHPQVALVLNNLANLYVAMGQPAKAAPLCARGLRIREAWFGKTHTTVAFSLRTQSSICWANHEPDEAIDLLQQAIEIFRVRLGKEHNSTSHALARLATYLDQTNRSAEAVRIMDQGLRGLRLHVARVLPVLPESEQLGFMVSSFEKDFLTAVSLGLNPKINEDNRLRTAGWVLNGKSVIHQSLAERLLLARDNQSGEGKRVLIDLEDVRRQLARLNLQTPNAGENAELRKEFETLRGKEKRLESRLSSAGSASRQDPWVEIDELRQKLAPKAVYVDFLRFTPSDSSSSPGRDATKPAPIYAAWISSRDNDTVIVNLGGADKIDAAIQAARTELQDGHVRIKQEGEILAEKVVREKLTAVSKLVLEPLLPHISRYPQWIFGPDGNLWLVPWACLPLDEERYVLEKHTLRYVTSGRDLVLNALQLDHRSGAPVIFADPDFDQEQNRDAGATYRSLVGKKLPGRIGAWNVAFEFTTDSQVVIRDQDGGGAVAGQGSWKIQGQKLTMLTSAARFEGTLVNDKITGQRTVQKKGAAATRDSWHLLLPAEAAVARLRGDSVSPPRQFGRVVRLPGTAAEADAITPALAKWAGSKPRRYIDKDATVGAFQRLKGPKVLVLATHGYFLPNQEVPEHLRNRNDESESRSASPGLENPLLRSGLLLAGCNRSAETRVGQDTGILTGLEIVGTDLRGTELVVLSACETGLGDIHNGEGVAGLRQAFQLAGAQTVVASLWKISDRETALLMKSFFEKMAAGQNKVDALRDAQLAMLRDRRQRDGAAHPFFWGAFTLTGR